MVSKSNTDLIVAVGCFSTGLQITGTLSFSLRFSTRLVDCSAITRPNERNLGLPIRQTAQRYLRCNAGHKGNSVKKTGSPLDLLENKTYRMLWIATLASNLGTLIQTVGAGWLMTTIATSPVQVALVAASTRLPVMLFALPAGALADSYDRRNIMLGAQVFMFLVSVCLALAAWFELLTPWSLLAFTFLPRLRHGGPQSFLAIVRARYCNPRGSNLSGAAQFDGVQPHALGRTRLGGFIVSVAGVAWAFVANAGSYVFLIGALIVWKRPESAANTLPREPFLLAVSASVRYVAMSPI